VPALLPALLVALAAQQLRVAGWQNACSRRATDLVSRPATAAGQAGTARLFPWGWEGFAQEPNDYFDAALWACKALTLKK